MVRMLLAISRFILGVALLPVCLFASRLLIALFKSLAERTGDRLIPLPFLAFGAGFIVWMLMYLFFSRPIRTYVLAHELSHALWGLVMGARVSKLKIRGDGGSVTLSKSNIWITLAPYFFPFYSVLVVILYGCLSCFWDVARWQYVWLWLIGFTWSFHCSFTISSLLQHQTDIQEYGYVLSYALIYFLNTLEVCVGLVAVSRLTLEQFMTVSMAEYDWIRHLLIVAYRSGSVWVSEFTKRLQ